MATTTGSGNFLNFHNSATAATAIKAVGMSMIERLAMTITEPVMAPMAAVDEGQSPGNLPYFLKYGAGIPVNR